MSGEAVGLAGQQKGTSLAGALTTSSALFTDLLTLTTPVWVPQAGGDILAVSAYLSASVSVTGDILARLVLSAGAVDTVLATARGSQSAGMALCLSLLGRAVLPNPLASVYTLRLQWAYTGVGQASCDPVAGEGAALQLLEVSQ